VASHCKLQKVIIEGDSKTCIEAISRVGSDPPWKIIPIVKDIWNRESCIPLIKYSWVYSEEEDNLCYCSLACIMVNDL
jgi:hypothetical protein